MLGRERPARRPPAPVPLALPSFHRPRASLQPPPLGRVVRLACLLTAAVGSAWADPYVASRATADSSYVARRRASNPPAPETYVFTPGRFFGGGVRDRTLERMPFAQIARTLAAGLREQRYFPAASTDEADLLIVVHWGVTDGYRQSPAAEGYQPLALNEFSSAMADRQALVDAGASPFEGEMTEITRRIDDLGAEINRQGEDLSLAGMAASQAAANAATLLGFAGELRDENARLMPSAKGALLNAMLREDRYFIVAVAYDWKAMRRDREPHRLWTARLSVRSGGVNFTEALYRLNLAGGRVFGRQIESLEVRRVREPEGKVEIGEVIVIGPAGPGESAPPPH